MQRRDPRVYLLDALAAGELIRSNQLAHGYFAIRHDVVWAIATNDLPRLLDDLRAALQRCDSE